MTRADDLFIQNCKKILSGPFSDEGMHVRPHWADGTPAHTQKAFCIVNRYDLQKEFPIMTLRQIFWKTALDEILWIYQKKSNRVNELKSHIWDSWADAEGTIGKAYGYQIGQKTQYPEGSFDQMDKVLYDLRHNPMSRSIITTTYNMQDLPEMGLRPCAYSMTYNVTRSPNDGKMILNGLLNQRSQDMLTANNWNTVQYALLLSAVAYVTGMIPGELVHCIADCHIYDRHIPIVQDMIKRYDETKAKGDDLSTDPTLTIDPKIDNFYDFTVDSFHVNDYVFDKTKYDIEVAI